MNQTLPTYPVLEYFETMYKLSDDLWGNSASELAKEAAALLKINFKDSKDLRILDLGCGSGRDSLFFAQQGWNVTAVDISQNALDTLNTHALESNLKNITTICSAIEDFKPLETYHLVFSNYSLHFVTRHARINLFDKIQNCTTENGINALLAIRDLNENHVGDLTNYHYLYANELAESYLNWQLLDDY